MISLGIGLGVTLDAGGRSLTLPASAGAPKAVWSAIKLSSWNGACLRLVRISDSAEQDIGFSGGAVNMAAADAFAAASDRAIIRVYDQSGNGFHLTQATASLGPSLDAGNSWNGITPFSVAANFTSSRQWLSMPALNIGRQTHSVYQAVAPISSSFGEIFWEFNDGATGAQSVLYNNSNTSLIHFGNGGAGVNLTGRLPAYLQTISFVSGASNRKIRLNGASTSFAALPALTMNAGGLVGNTVTASYYSKFNLFCLVVYDAAHDDTQAAAVDTALTNTFKVPTAPTKNLVYGGSSLILGVDSLRNLNPVIQQRWSSDWRVWNMGLTGVTLATEYANRAANEFVAYSGSFAKNILVIDAPSNDISGATYADVAAAEAAMTTLYNGTTLAFVTAAASQGFTKTVVPTIVARGSFTTGNFKEQARLFYNNLVTAGATANGYVASDRAGEALLGATGAASNTAVFAADQTHLNIAGSALLAAIDKAAILAAAA